MGGVMQPDIKWTYFPTPELIVSQQKHILKCAIRLKLQFVNSSIFMNLRTEWNAHKSLVPATKHWRLFPKILHYINNDDPGLLRTWRVCQTTSCLSYYRNIGVIES